MTNTINISARKMIDVDVFLNDQDEIIGYQLGRETMSEFTAKSPFPVNPPVGTKASLTVKVYGKVEYMLDNHTRQTEIVKYEADFESLKNEVEAKLKEADRKGICISYSPITATGDNACSNCSYKTICP